MWTAEWWWCLRFIGVGRRAVPSTNTSFQFGLPAGVAHWGSCHIAEHKERWNHDEPFDDISSGRDIW